MEGVQSRSNIIQEEYQLEDVKELLEKLNLWWKESNRQFTHREISQLISHTQNINKGVNVLAEEVYDLKSRLAEVTKVRDELLEKGVPSMTKTIRQEYLLGEINLLLEKLSVRETLEFSHKEIYQLISHTQRIKKGVNVMAEEVNDLRNSVANITRERDELLEKVAKLNDENMQLRAVIKIVQPDPVERNREEDGMENRISQCVDEISLVQQAYHFHPNMMFQNASFLILLILTTRYEFL